MSQTTESIVALLLERGERLSLAESCTGGALSQRFTSLAGVSAVFYEGLVTYATASKIDRLGLSADFIAQHGVVSEEVARAMAESLRLTGVEASLATTGIAGPRGGTEAAPLGCVCIAASYLNQSISKRYLFDFVSRQQVIDEACQKALAMLLTLISES